jgi:hypothetical protein
LSGEKERFTETEEEVVFEIEIEDLRHLVVPPEQDPSSDRPLEYLGQPAMERMMRNIRPPGLFRRAKKYRLIIRMPSEKVIPESKAQAKALLTKYGTRMIADNDSRIAQIQKRGRRQLPFAFVVLVICIGLGILFGLELFVDQNPILALAISEGFYIVGWIALWRPMDVLLFDPMEVRMESNLLRRLMEMPIDSVPI